MPKQFLFCLALIYGLITLSLEPGFAQAPIQTSGPTPGQPPRQVTVGCELTLLARVGQNGTKAINPERSCSTTPIHQREICEQRGDARYCEVIDTAELSFVFGKIRASFDLFSEQAILSTQVINSVSTTKASVKTLNDPEGLRLYTYFESSPISYNGEKVVGTAVSCATGDLAPVCETDKTESKDPTVQREID